MYTQALPYSKNSRDLFEHVVHLPYPVFLDSCKPYESQGRFDIIAADPTHIISSEKNIFHSIRAALNTLKKNNTADNLSHLPFTIGAIGYLSYDISRELENIPSIAKNDIAIPTALVGIYAWSIVIDHEEKKTTLVYSDHYDIQKIIALLNTSPNLKKAFALSTPFTSNMTKEKYSDAFDQIKNHITAGNCYQVNLAQRFSAQFKGSPWHAYQQLREKNAAPYAAFMQFNEGCILSLSPERFLRVRNRQVETKPIKGTMPRFSDPKEDIASATALCNSEKDRAENVMIVDLLRNDLSRVCKPGSVKTPHLCALESFSNVHHLVSTVTGELSDTHDSLDLLQQCFPGGSITGAPKIAAIKIIELLEPHRRSLYCGSLFYLDILDNLDSSIAIRTVICDKENMHCYAGGGIVHDSDCEKEYAETWSKVGKIIRILDETME